VHCLLLLYSFQFPHYLSFKFSDLHIIWKKIKSILHSESKLENSQWADCTAVHTGHTCKYSRSVQSHMWYGQVHTVTRVTKTSVPRGCVPQGGSRGGRVPHVPGTRELQGGRFPTSPFWGDAAGLGGTQLPKVGNETPQKGDSWTSPLEKGNFWTPPPPPPKKKGGTPGSPPKNFFAR
jgi:hypothetical protein